MLDPPFPSKTQDRLPLAGMSMCLLSKKSCNRIWLTQAGSDLHPVSTGNMFPGSSQAVPTPAQPWAVVAVRHGLSLFHAAQNIHGCTEGWVTQKDAALFLTALEVQGQKAHSWQGSLSPLMAKGGGRACMGWGTPGAALSEPTRADLQEAGFSDPGTCLTSASRIRVSFPCVDLRTKPGASTQGAPLLPTV